MTAIDKAINDTNSNICKNIAQSTILERGFISQNILGQLRNFVEYIAMKVCSSTPDVDPNDYELRCKLLEKLKTRGDFRFLYKFHDLLQKSASHYTLDENASERLMLKYYEELLKIKKFLSEKYKFSVLENIMDFPINTDRDMEEFYQKISEKIDNYRLDSEQLICKDRLYIQKIKPFFVNEKVYYEVTFTLATDNVSKFDRVIAFTNLEIVDNYSVYLEIHKDTISIINNEMEINIIDSWKPTIRPCELDNFSFIFNGNKKLKSNSKSYEELMRFIHDSKMNLLDLIISSDEFYNNIKNKNISFSNNSALFEIFDACRNIILNKKSGSNILRYLLFNLNNKILKNQINWNERCEKLSNLYLDYGTIPFDKMPFVTSLRGHNPRISDLFECMQIDGREYEFLVRYIKTNTEQNDTLFTIKKDLIKFGNIDELINQYNSSLYYKHRPRREINSYLDYVYVNEYIDDCSFIIRKFQELSKTGLKNYSASVENWLAKNPGVIDDVLKRNALINMFENSKVAFIYGSAGTGKSTLIRHISEFFAAQKKIFLANTNPAVENLKRKVRVANCEYKTISKFISSQIKNNYQFDILFVDECSTVSNADMRQILENTKFKLIVLVGDIYQIEAIQFGNWFSISKQFVKSCSIFELTNIYRSSERNLKIVWDRVRNIDEGMQEALDKFDYTKRLDNSVFSKNNEDEIILCLNYDGLYGINNINTFLQRNNKNKAYVYGVHSYKVDDPILFNESNIFSPVIYNNMKGWIRNIQEDELEITFDIEIEATLNELDVYEYSFTLIGNAENGNSIIRFSVDKTINTDDDNNTSAMPFQIAYAISIHKAQGLEYDSVKIIISDEIEEQISHNIFYTAITRARKNLQIYWSPEVEKNVLSNLRRKDSNKRDAYLLKNLCSL